MYSQRSGVAGSLEIQIVLTSSLSAKLNGFILLNLVGYPFMYLLSKLAERYSQLR